MELMNESELPMKIIFRQVGAKIAYYRTLRYMEQDELATKKIVETLNDKEKLEKAVNVVSKKAVDLLQDGKVVKKIADVSAKQATKVLDNEKVMQKLSQD